MLSIYLCEEGEGEREEGKNTEGEEEEGREAETQIETKGIQALGVQDGLVRLCYRKGTEPDGVLGPVPSQWPSGPASSVRWAGSTVCLPELHPPCMVLVPFTGKKPVNSLFPETPCEQIPWTRKGCGPFVGALALR